MRKLSVFNNISLDGFFTDARGDMSAFHARNSDPEFAAWTAENAQGGTGTLLFGRKTYEEMASFWPSDMAKQQMPEVAEGMNRMDKLVVSRSLASASWENTRVIRDLISDVRALKAGSGDDILILGSGEIVAQLTEARLIDSYTLVIVPIIFGAGRSLFAGAGHIPLERVSERAFAGGQIVASYVLSERR